ncbi:MAG TPA: hypothetical protein VFB50_17760 [Chloroflexota bacterium]|nr:hypothetical protein [Chloroflexota bacterium]
MNAKHTRIDKLVDAVHHLVETNHLLLARQLGLPEPGLLPAFDEPLELEAAPRPLPHFWIEAWNTYDGLVRDLRAREAALPKGTRCTRKAITSNTGGDTLRTLNRALDYWHLTSRTGLRTYWPPSIFPDTEPPARPENQSIANKAAMLLAGFGASRVLLDVASDGKLDGAVAWCRVFGPLLQHPIRIGMLHLH